MATTIDKAVAILIDVSGTLHKLSFELARDGGTQDDYETAAALRAAFEEIGRARLLLDVSQGGGEENLTLQ